MNIYDTKSIHCSRCEKFIGEIDYNAIVIFPKCGKCVKQLLEENDTMNVTSEYKEIPVMLHEQTLC